MSGRPSIVSVCASLSGKPHSARLSTALTPARPSNSEPAALPRRQERAAHVVSALGEILAARLWFRARILPPIASLREQVLVAQAAEQDVVGRGVLGVELEALALEPLHLQRAAVDLLLLLRTIG